MDHNTQTNRVVTRYAPSPTGFQHVGGLRTAIFAYLWARKNAGEFILRIEDTDKGREVAGAIEHTIEALHWLGLDYDFGPDKPHPKWGSALQSDRLAIYKQYAHTLIERGLAYPDPYSSEELAAFRERAQNENRPFLFRDHRPKETGEWDDSQPLRLKVPELKRYEWHDVVRGKLSAGLEALDDFILVKADGYPTYNFAHIVDDAEMGVTHVMRGEEFISSTPKFLSLYDALDLPWPTFVTLPPIMGPDGKRKLSKRDGAKDLLDYRTDGYLPNAMCNFLALIGWNPGDDQELFYTQAELISAFSLEKIQRSGGAFNEEKLKWMNKEHLETLSTSERTAYVVNAIPEYDHDTLAALSETMLERVHTQAEIRAAIENGEYDWAFGNISYDSTLLKWKNDEGAAAAKPRLEHLHSLLENADFSTPDTIKSHVWSFAEEEGRGEVLWPLRIALTGRERSPDPFTCAYALGKEESCTRVKLAIAKL